LSAKRENFTLYSVDESLIKVANPVVFSKLDTSSSFWQPTLAKESCPLLLRLLHRLVDIIATA